MVSIPLRIFIHGLIALVPTTDSSGTKMTALLVDGRIEDRAHCMSEHHPELRVHVAQDADCISAGCKSNGSGDCDCAYDPQAHTEPLFGKQLWFEISPSPILGTEKPDSSLPGRGLPDDSREAGNFSYVANLSQDPFGLRIAPKYLLPNPPQDARDHMVTRMEAPYKSITACSLATRQDGGEANVHAMSFRKLGDPSDSGDIGYALAEMVVTELAVPDGGTVKLHISDFGGANDHEMSLASETVQPSRDIIYKVRLSNEPKAPLSYDDTCDDGVARHFSHFYELAENPAGPPLIPHVRLTQFKSSIPLQPRICKDLSFALSDRPICPMVTFNP